MFRKTMCAKLHLHTVIAVPPESGGHSAPESHRASVWWCALKTSLCCDKYDQTEVFIDFLWSSLSACIQNCWATKDIFRKFYTNSLSVVKNFPVRAEHHFEWTTVSHPEQNIFSVFLSGRRGKHIKKITIILVVKCMISSGFQLEELYQLS